MIYRTFTASILAAVTMARGTGDGLSKEDASELKLVDFGDFGYYILTLYSYTEYSNGNPEHMIELEYKCNNDC